MPEAARRRLDEQQAKLRDRLRFGNDEDRADDLSVALGDPAALALRIEVVDEVGDDARDEGLEAFVPAVLLGVEHAVAMDDPAHVAGAVRRAAVYGCAAVW